MTCQSRAPRRALWWRHALFSNPISCPMSVSSSRQLSLQIESFSQSWLQYLLDNSIFTKALCSARDRGDSAALRFPSKARYKRRLRAMEVASASAHLIWSDETLAQRALELSQFLWLQSVLCWFHLTECKHHARCALQLHSHTEFNLGCINICLQ